MIMPARKTWRRLGKEQKGQAAVETIFALTVLALLLLVIAQLFVISDLAAGVMAAAHYKGLKAVHALDGAEQFKGVETSYNKTVQALPGMNMALRHWNQSGTPGSYTVSRSVHAYGGSFTNSGNHKFCIDGDGMAYCTGKRAIRFGQVIGY